MESSPNSESVFASFRHRFQTDYAIDIPCLSTILIWAIGFGFSITMTIRDFLPLLSEYNDNNVATQVDIMLWDDQFKPPQLVLCLPRSKLRNKFGDDLMSLAVYLNGSNSEERGRRLFKKWDNLSLDIWNDTVQSAENRDHFKSLYSNLSLAIVKRILTSSKGMEEVSDGEPQNIDHPVISAIINYLEWQEELDYNLQHVEPNQNYKFQLTPNPDFFKDIQEYDTKIDMLFDQASKYLCAAIKYSEREQINDFVNAYVVNRSCQDWLQGQQNPFYWALEGLWSVLPPAGTPKIKEYHITLPLPQNDPIPSLGSDPNNRIMIYPDLSAQYVNALDPSFSSYIFQISTDKSQVGHMVTVRYSVQIRAKEARRGVTCHEGTSATTCFVQCTKEWLLKTCACKPLILKMGLPDVPVDELPYCKLPDYISCNLTILPDEVKAQCKKRCSGICDFTTYTWQISYATFDVEGGSELILQMAPVFETFAEFSMTTKNTPEQFFSQLAGLANFYLGFSGLTLFALAASCLEWYKNFKKSKAKNSGSQMDGVHKCECCQGQRQLNNYQKSYVNGNEVWLIKLKDQLKTEIEDAIRRDMQIVKTSDNKMCHIS